VLGRLRAFWTRTGHRERLTATLAPLLASVEGRVLDVGGGRRASHDAAWTTRARRVRVDLSPAHRPDVRADAARLPVRDASIDAVVLIQLLEHVPDPAAVVDEAHRVLHGGGRVIGSVPFVAAIHGDPSDFFRFSEHAVRHLLRRFDTVRVQPIGNHYGAAWDLLAARSRTLRLMNPLLRRLGGRPDRRCPQGYLFVATR
jgi:SAM-dependent methyltransferase